MGIMHAGFSLWMLKSEEFLLDFNSCDVDQISAQICRDGTQTNKNGTLEPLWVTSQKKNVDSYK